MFGLRLLWRDWRAGELAILIAALVIAVAIVTGISLFADRLQKSILAQSLHFLAADRVLQSSAPVPADWLQQATDFELSQAQVVGFQSVVYGGSELDAPMQLTSIKAVSDLYPLRGELEVSEQPFAGSFSIASAPPAGEVWLDPRLFALLNLNIGDKLYVGEAQLKVTKVIVNEPDRGSQMFNFSPRVLMNAQDVPATNIIQPGSRVSYRYLFAGKAENLSRYSDWIQPRLSQNERWRNLEDSQPRIYRSLQNAEQFLLLAGSLGVGLAGIAIALAARRYSERHYDAVAMMKTLGATAAKILSIYIANLCVLGLLGILIGCALGWIIHELFFQILQRYIDLDILPVVSARPFLIGSGTALLCLLAFALPPLINLQAISPLRVLRRDMESHSFGNMMSYTFGGVGIVLLIYWYSGSAELTFSILAGLLITVAIVAVLAWYILRGTAHIGMQAGSSWRLALASLRRRGVQNAVQAVMFSLAIMLLLMLALVRTSLIEEWQLQLPEGTPNHFLINIAKDQVGDVESLIRKQGIDSEPIYPMVRGRLVSINDAVLKRRSEQNAEPDSEADNSSSDGSGSNNTSRGMNLTWSTELPPDNTLIAGEWWPKGSDQPLVSVESELAERMDIVVGDQLEFLIGSQSLRVKVASLRALNWDSMKPNFYMVFPKPVLESFPATFMTSFHLPPEKKPFLSEFLRSFPTVSVIEMDSIIRQIRSIINNVSSAIELVLGLIIVSGLLVLMATLQASLDSRIQESALLRALGARRELVTGSLVIEFAVLGLIAGVIAALSSELSVYAIQTYVLEMDYVPHPWVWVVGPIIGMLLIAVAGFLACKSVVNTPPIKVLREI